MAKAMKFGTHHSPIRQAIDHAIASAQARMAVQQKQRGRVGFGGTKGVGFAGNGGVQEVPYGAGGGFKFNGGQFSVGKPNGRVI